MYQNTLYYVRRVVLSTGVSLRAGFISVLVRNLGWLPDVLSHIVNVGRCLKAVHRLRCGGFIFVLLQYITYLDTAVKVTEKKKYQRGCFCKLCSRGTIVLLPQNRKRVVATEKLRSLRVWKTLFTPSTVKKVWRRYLQAGRESCLLLAHRDNGGVSTETCVICTGICAAAFWLKPQAGLPNAPPAASSRAGRLVWAAASWRRLPHQPLRWARMAWHQASWPPWAQPAVLWRAQVRLIEQGSGHGPLLCGASSFQRKRRSPPVLFASTSHGEGAGSFAPPGLALFVVRKIELCFGLCCKQSTCT